MDIDLSVDCRFIIPMVEALPKFLTNYTIGVLKDKIICLEKSEIFYERFKPKQRYDLSKQNSVVFPGLINAHTHTALSLLRGYSDDVPLKIWLEDFIWPAELKFVTPEFVQQGAKLSIWEMLKTGTTMFNDMYFMPDHILEICKQSKIRAILGKPCIHISDTHIDKQVEESVNFVESVSKVPNPSMQSSVNPHSLYSLPPQYHKDLIEKSAHLGPIYHTHLNETKSESPDFYAKTGKTTVEALEEIGALNSNCVLAHCVWMEYDEVELLAKKGANVVHCPRSNMKLGSGVCNAKLFLDMGINVCLGTDSACSNNSLDMLLEAQTASLLAKVHCLDASALDDYTVLKMATINGAKALKRDHDLGSLEVGKLADFVCVCLDSFQNLPILDPISPLIFTSAREIKYVWIGGEMVVEDGNVLTVQPDRENIEHIAEKLKFFKENSSTIS